jgi:peptide deformylase
MRVQIVHWPSPVLLDGTKPITQEELDADFRDTVENMARLMYDLRGVGLAAPQVGIARRFMLVCPTGDLGDEEVAINPEILAQEGEEEMEEGCLSFPRVYGTIRRPAKVKVRYRDLDWKERNVDLDGYVARIFQHELDHLNGIVFTTRMTQADLVRNKARLDEMKKAFTAFKA